MLCGNALDEIALLVRGPEGVGLVVDSRDDIGERPFFGVRARAFYGARPDVLDPIVRVLMRRVFVDANDVVGCHESLPTDCGTTQMGEPRLRGYASLGHYTY